MYIVFMIASGLLVAGAARERRMAPGLWGLWAFLLPFAGIPYFLASRNLKQGESRRGGFWWSVTRYAALVWSVFCFAWGLRSLIGNRSVEEVIAGSIFIFAAWIAPTAMVLVIGFLLKTDEVERGPTGALAGDCDGPEMAGRG